MTAIATNNNQRYYLHRQLKKACISYNATHKTIYCNYLVTNKYIDKLFNNHNYTIQYTI